jgi:FAD/FMN-containing dehydrogenase
MSAQIEALGKLVRGEITTEEEYINFYSTDGSIFEIKPKAIFFPKDTEDVQTAVKFLHKEASSGEVLPLIPRGFGTDQGGGPLGKGLVVDFTRHMNQILAIGEDFVRVQPGARYAEVQKLLKGKGRYLPPYPASIELCSIGGAIANNSAGEKTIKYGSTRKYVESLKVILSNGELIETKALDGYEVGVKKRMGNFEAEIYKDLDELLVENWKTIKEAKPHVSKNSAGFALWEIERYGKMDLAQLFTGSQGTLGIVTEVLLRTVPFPSKTSLVVGYFRDLHNSGEAVTRILHLNPSALEVVDKNLLQMVKERKPEQLKGLLPPEMPAIVLLIEFDDQETSTREKKVKATKTILKEFAFALVEKDNPQEQAELWKLRRSAAAVMWTIPGKKKALPIIEDGCVHASLLPEFFKRAYSLFEKYDLEIAVWGHAGDANLHMQPFLDLSKAEDRSKVFDLMNDFYSMLLDLDGTTCGEHNDGLTRSPYLRDLFGSEVYTLFKKVKKIFDPHGFLNPMKKVGVELSDVRSLVRDEYSMKHLVTNREQIDR